MNTWIGILLVTLAGLGTGTIAWPMKLMRRLSFEHYWFLAMLVSLVIFPWVVVLCCVPSPWEVYAKVGWRPILLCNLFSFGWGIANVLYGICVLRIGAALTGAILSGVGAAAGVTLPMVLKGSGVSQKGRTSPPRLAWLFCWVSRSLWPASSSRRWPASDAIEPCRRARPRRGPRAVF